MRVWSRPVFGSELRAELGSPTRPRRLSSSPRSCVWQADLDGTAVVIKQIVGGTDAPERFDREVTALRLASRVDPPVAPELVGTDRSRRMLVLEHIDHHNPADGWVVEYAVALARLHAATNRADAGRLPRWSGPGADDVAAFCGLAGALGVPVPPRAAGELDDLINSFGHAAGHSLLHGDPCPGNDLHTSGGVRFVDFEQASLGSGLTELAYLRIGFPTCWCVTAAPEGLLREAEEAYRTAWRTATSTEPQGDLAAACAGWLLQGDALVERAQRGRTNHLARALRQDWRWGTATARQRLLHRLGVVAQITADHPDLANVGRVSADIHGRMLARWPVLQPLPRHRP